MVRGRERRSERESLSIVSTRSVVEQTTGWFPERSTTHRIRVTLESVQDLFFSQIPDLHQNEPE
jgi:hypothetical protein